MTGKQSFGGGRYVVEGLLGQGGQKCVYLVQDTVLGRPCALSIVEGDAVPADAMDRVRREARALARMRPHPNIVTVYDLGEDRGRPFIVSELVPGGDLAAEVAKHGALPASRVIAIALDLLRALDAVHRTGVVHRDLKPGNVWLTEDGAPKLGDFGLAIGVDAPRVTEAGALHLTPSYAAPEQLQGADLDARADLYALGCTLYELLAGRPPFVGATHAVIAQHLHAAPASPARYNPDAPKSLVDFILRLLAKSPDDRPSSAAAAIEELGARDRIPTEPMGDNDARARPFARMLPHEPEGAPLASYGSRSFSAIPLFGRDEELQRIERALEAASDPESAKVVLLRGEPGIGKTTLLDELARRVLARNGTVLRAGAFEAEMSRPNGVWIDALASSVLSDLEDRTRFFEEAVAVMKCAKKPAVVILDDIHWIDEASAALLHFAVRAVRGEGILIAVGSRKAELEDNAAAAKVIASLGRSGWLETIDLAPLDEASTEQLVSALATGADPKMIYQESAGNPLFAIEVARALRAGSASETLDGLFADRLRRLSERARGALAWAAALGRSFELQLLIDVSETPELDIVDAIDELEHRGVLVPAGQGAACAYDFHHDLLRRAAHQSISDARRRFVHRKIARTLAAASGAQSVRFGEIARHAELGGEPVLTALYSVKAGELCLRLHAYQEARALAERARRFLSSVPEEMRLDLHIRLIGLYFHPRVEAHVARALDEELLPLLEEAKRSGRADQLARAFSLRMWFEFSLGDVDRAAKTSISRAEMAGSLEEPEDQARALGHAAACLATVERDMASARQLFFEARALSERLAREFYEVCWAEASLAYFDGDFDIARTLYMHTLDLGSDEMGAWGEWSCRALLAKIDLELGRFGPAAAHALELARLAEKLGEGSARPFAAAITAIVRLAADDPRASETLESAVHDLISLSAKADLAYVLHRAAAVDLSRGRVEAARTRASQALTLAEAGGWGSDAASARDVLARAALAVNDRAEAMRHFKATEPARAAPGQLRARVRESLLSLASALEGGVATSLLP